MAELDRKVSQLRVLISNAVQSPAIRNLAGRVIGNKINDTDQAVAIYDYVRSNIRYVREPKGQDIFQSAETTLALGAGDCEDEFVLVGALARLAGIPVKAKVISQDSITFTHIYPLLKVNGKWVPMDTTLGGILGREPQYLTGRIYSI